MVKRISNCSYTPLVSEKDKFGKGKTSFVDKEVEQLNTSKYSITSPIHRIVTQYFGYKKGEYTLSLQEKKLKLRVNGKEFGKIISNSGSWVLVKGGKEIVLTGKTVSKDLHEALGKIHGVWSQRNSDTKEDEVGTGPVGGGIGVNLADVFERQMKMQERHFTKQMNLMGRQVAVLEKGLEKLERGEKKTREGKLEGAIKALVEENAKLVEQNEKCLQSALEAKEVALNAFAKSAEEKDRALDALRSKNQELRRVVDELLGKGDGQAAKIQELEKALEESKYGHNGVAVKNGELTRALESLESQGMAAKGRIAQLETECEKLDGKNAGLERALEAEKEKARGIEKEIERLTGEKKELERAAIGYAKNSDGLEEELRKAYAEKMRVLDGLLQKSQERLQEQSENYARTLRVVDSESKGKEKEIEKLEEEIETRNQAIERLEAKINMYALADVEEKEIMLAQQAANLAEMENLVTQNAALQRLQTLAEDFVRKETTRLDERNKKLQNANTEHLATQRQLFEENAMLRQQVALLTNAQQQTASMQMPQTIRDLESQVRLGNMNIEQVTNRARDRISYLEMQNAALTIALNNARQENLELDECLRGEADRALRANIALDEIYAAEIKL